ncbi:Peptidoglycan-binding LysM [Chthoniobacter flavus Ellin428]|uniref:Peptidoglycan-binding LysM n=1 Tax=Chthoniobacter flavus Ellin428 TaxID=497964 RepID=B4D7A2_9BACT|nr:LysM domain-containing protein [Chthoniobacter flavus]EDY17753.1 Peptidoglycan-binding LysM [Chthoniobacter flavus Ellin428]TCO87078.1 LysM domain-containing protein [Chthoniobacter flavus]
MWPLVYILKLSLRWSGSVGYAMAMTPKYAVLALSVAVFASPVLHATSSASLEQEYQQERTIALRDPKVRAAYEEADRKLEAKIIQIDPALADYVHHRGTGPEKPVSTPKPVVARPYTPKKPAATVGGFHTTHTVAKGETLGGIASQYGVSVTALKTANHITDEKKLSIGTVLSVPPKTK